MSLAIELAEQRLLPDRLIRTGVRRLLSRRLVECNRGVAGMVPAGMQPIAIETAAANAQHYEVSPEFFERVLGKHRKYSCCWFESPASTLDDAEAAMLELTCERAGITDGMDILELGCGWGSLTLWMAERYPHSTITAISNSRSQRQTIEFLARERGLQNVTVVTADINQYRPEWRFDRIVSVEMFEHVRNHVLLLERIAQWLRPGGRLFLHVFCHDRHTYTFEDRGSGDWMARHFFSGGMMPSFDYFRSLPVPFQEVSSWRVNGLHYVRTCRAWLDRLDAQGDALGTLFAVDRGSREAARTVQRWRMFFMACEELFGWRGGEEWYVGHYLLAPDSRKIDTEALGS